MKVPVRVVVWYDERKLSTPGGSVPANMVGDIITAVKAASFDTEGFLITKAKFTGLEHDPVRIWARYGLSVNDSGLFMLPYSTFAVNFDVMGRFNPACFTQPITVDLTAC